MELVKLILVLATVVSVADGKTIRIQDDAGGTMTVKLACIDVPETNQRPDGLAAKEKLKKLLPPGIPVVIRSIEKDENGRIVGEVFVDNRSVNLRLVEEGNAVIDEQALDNCYESKTQFLIAEANAKNKRLGLWQRLYSIKFGNRQK